MLNNFKRIKYNLTINILFYLFMPFSSQAQIDISYEEIGKFMGSYLCRSLIEKNTMDDQEIMEEFANDLVTKYGEEKALIVINEVEEAFAENKQSSHRNDVDLMRGVFQHMIDNDNCWENFVKEEVFQ